MKYGIQAKQLSTSGVAVGQRSYMKKIMVMHSAGSDAVIRFYDRTTAPGQSDPFYEVNAYGKGVLQVDMPDDGVLFNTGVYVVIPASCIVTVWYEEA